MPNSQEIKFLAAGIQNPAASLLSKAPVTLGKSAVPLIVAPNGTVATNGTITLGTALPLIYTAAWVRLPAGAVVGGLAGLYYTVFSSTTVGQVYTNYADVATAFTGAIPTATLVAAVGSNAGYTQATASDLSLALVTVPGNTLGTDGSVTVTVFESNNGTAGAKNVTAKFGGTSFLTADVTTSLALETSKSVTNRGVVNKQLVHANAAFGNVSTVAPTQLTVDTSASADVVITGKVAVATDYIIVESFTVKAQLA